MKWIARWPIGVICPFTITIREITLCENRKIGEGASPWRRVYVLAVNNYLQLYRLDYSIAPLNWEQNCSCTITSITRYRDLIFINRDISRICRIIMRFTDGKITLRYKRHISLLKLSSRNNLPSHLIRRLSYAGCYSFTFTVARLIKVDKKCTKKHFRRRNYSVMNQIKS